MIHTATTLALNPFNHMERLTHAAAITRDYYIKQFLKEYMRYKTEVFLYNLTLNDSTKKSHIACEEKSYYDGEKLTYAEIKRMEVSDTKKMYRDDFVIYNFFRGVESHLCWPVIIDEYKHTVTDDIPYFQSFETQVNNTSIFINPFLWQICEITFHPNAESVKALIESWFYRWFYSKEKAKTLKGVIHNIIGPYENEDKSETYYIDFGSAPVKAFVELIKQSCGHKVKKITISP